LEQYFEFAKLAATATTFIQNAFSGILLMFKVAHHKIEWGTANPSTPRPVAIQNDCVQEEECEGRPQWKRIAGRVR
jgi:hypothetical protein